MRLKHVTVAVFCLLICGLVVLADTLTLKDGTVLEGKVIPQADSYWIKLPSGETRVVPKAQVAGFSRGDVKPKPTAPTPSEASGAATAAPTGGSSSFAMTKSKADRVDAAILAVSLWEKFIDSKPALSDLEAAKVELAKWQKMQKEGAEKINGKWIGGDDRKKLLKKVEDLIEEGSRALKDNQTHDGITKFEEALKLNPQSFAANFELGYFYLTKGLIGSNGQGNNQFMDKAIKSLETAAKIMPNSAATWSNLAIGYNFKRKYAESVKVAYKAVQIRETDATVQNLINSIAQAPPGMQQNNASIKPIMEDAIIMAGRHGINSKGGRWFYVRPTDTNSKDPSAGGSPADESGPAGVVWSGSAFFVTADGYIITNHHVATGDPKSPIKKNITFRVRMDDGTEKNADLIAVSDKFDIALMKINSDSPVPFLLFADDNPRQAAKALVLGYPATGSSDQSLQISEGQVKSLHPGEDYEVWYDLNTTHGNSGGPIVDKSGHVISILTAGRTVYNVTYVMGVGPKQIKEFLETLGDKAPKVVWAAPDTTISEFDGEKLTEQAKKSTLLVLAIRGAEKSEPDADEKDDKSEKPPGGANTPSTPKPKTPADN